MFLLIQIIHVEATLIPLTQRRRTTNPKPKPKTNTQNQKNQKTLKNTQPTNLETQLNTIKTQNKELEKIIQNKKNKKQTPKGHTHKKKKWTKC